MHPWITLHIQQALVEHDAEHEMVSREGERPDGARQRAGHAAKQRVSEVRRLKPDPGAEHAVAQIARLQCAAP